MVYNKLFCFVFRESELLGVFVLIFERPHEVVHRLGEENRSVSEMLFRACVDISSVARLPTVCGL